MAEIVWSGFGNSVGASNGIPQGVDTSLFPLMLTQMNISRSMNALMSLDRLSFNRGVSTTLAATAQEFARQYLLANSTRHTLADAELSEIRLHVRPIALWAMVAGFLLLGAISALLMTTSNQWVVPGFGGSIAAHSTVLTKSHSMSLLLDGTGYYSKNQMQERLRNFRFTARQSDKSLVIEALEATDTIQEPSFDIHMMDEPWYPLTANTYIIALTLGLPIIAIVILEILQTLSDQRNGLFTMGAGDLTSLSYGLRIASTLLLFAIATIFGNLKSDVEILTPFSQLRIGSVTADSSISSHLVGVSPFLSLFHALRAGAFGAASSNIATLIGSFLTIVVSGLWIVGDPIVIQTPSSALLDTWTDTWLDHTVNDGGASELLNTIRHGGKDTPKNILNNDMVLPKVSLSPGNLLNAADRNRYAFNVSVLQPTFECSRVPEKDVFTNETTPGQWRVVQVNTTAPAGCADSPSGKTGYTFGSGISGAAYYGDYFDITRPNTANPESSCPSVVVLFGYAKAKDVNLTVLLCSQGIKETPAVVAYIGNATTFDLDPKQPPVLALDQARHWHNSTSGGVSFQYRAGDFMNAHLGRFFYSVGQPIKESDIMDPFFDNLLWGPNNYSINALLGPDNSDQLIAAVTQKYKEYMNLVIDMNFRMHISSSNELKQVTGTNSQTAQRLGIHRPSKIILQVLLALMVALGIVSHCLVKMRGLLPRSPCSIASVMGFLAGSQLCDPDSGIIPHDTKSISKSNLQHVLDGWVFSLGWWRRIEDDDDSSQRMVVTNSNDFGISGSLDASKYQVVGFLKPHLDRRFGIDIGRPSALGFSQSKAMRFRKRALRSESTRGLHDY